MKIITEAQKSISNIWGEQKIKHTQYRLLKYIIPVPIDDEIFLHNVVTGELIQLDALEKSIISCLPCNYEKILDDLIKKHFLVPVNYDEEKSIDQIQKIYRQLHKGNYINHFTILPTTFCNARCFYCYESDYEHINMSEETATKLIDYMVSRSKNHPITINWFGGEPLLGRKIINYISKALAAQNIVFCSEMYSNGYLLSEELIEEAIKVWNLRKIQITIDGTEEVYNSTKAYISINDNPYTKVLQNIENLLQKNIRVDIRLNLGLHNIDDISNLVDELLNRFGQYENALIYVRRLFDDQGFIKVVQTENDKKILSNKQYELDEKIRKDSSYKEKFHLPYLKTNNCMADNDHAEVIYPDGKIFKCEHVSNEDCIGNIYSDARNQKCLEKWQDTVIYSACKLCCLRPKCRILKYCEGSVVCHNSDREYKILAYQNLIKEYIVQKLQY